MSPQSINEATLEYARIDAEVQRERIKRQAEVKVARANRRMDGHTRATMIGSVVAIIGVITFAVTIALNFRAGSAETAEVAKACVSSGAEWKQNISGRMECVR